MRLAQSLSLPRCGAYCGGLRPRGCPFESHPAQHRTSHLPSLAVRGSRLRRSHRSPRPSRSVRALLGANRHATAVLFISDRRRRSRALIYSLATASVRDSLPASIVVVLVVQAARRHLSPVENVNEANYPGFASTILLGFESAKQRVERDDMLHQRANSELRDGTEATSSFRAGGCHSNAAIPVRSSPRIRLWMSWVPS